MRKMFVGCLAVVGGLAILFVLLIFVIAIAAGGSGTPSVASKTVLEVNLETGLVEDVPEDPVAKTLLGSRASVRDVVDALERASTDERVAGMVARIGATPMGMAQIQEIRDAVKNFRAHKKFAVAWGETFGEVGPGTGSYYLATAFDQVWLQPSGDIGLTGIMMETMFLKGGLDKLGIVPRMDHRYEYKNAMNQFTEKKYTAPHREALQKVMDSWFAQLVRGIAEGRKLSEEQVRGLIDRGPYLGQEAVDAKLVDGLAYRDEVLDKVAKLGGKDTPRIQLSKYLAAAGRLHTKGKTIALIYGAGSVMRGKSKYDPIFGSSTMGSDTVAAAFRSAIDHPSVKAIVFRVDSPGGSYVASDSIWRETVRARKAGKPVIVSMGNLAGSGGYFVAMAADKIVAQPGTITGSIGVLGGKMVTTGAWDKIGISYDEIHAGKNATIWSTSKDYSPEEWKRFEAWLDRVYADFTSKVADGRHLPKEKVLEIAKGRIWSGEDAKQLGLVDELGGFPVALALARKAARISDKEDFRIEQFPRKKTTFEALMDRFQQREESGEIGTLTRMLEILQPYARQVRAATQAGETLEMPGFEVRQ